MANGIDSMFQSYFGKSALLGLADEQITTFTDGSTRITVDVPGADPNTINVAHRGAEISLRWTDRLGALRTKSWTIASYGEMRASVRNGLLQIDVSPGELGKWVTVPVEVG